MNPFRWLNSPTYSRFMKYRFFIPFAALLFSVLFNTGCEEEPPGVVFTEVQKPLLDTTYVSAAPSAQLKNVLLIDITGVGCKNCPAAAIDAKNILKAHPGRVNLMAMYPYIIKPNSLTSPYAGYDTVTTDEADNYLAGLGSIGGIPTGIVDQVKQNNSYFIPVASWFGLVDSRLLETTPVNIDLSGKWIASENKSRLEVKLSYNQNLDTSKKHRIHIAILEDGIIGKQANSDTAGSYQYFYRFDHVMRRLITPSTGELLKEKLTAGRVFEKHYFIAPRYNWKSDKLSALVWVTDDSDKQVLHSQEVALK